MGNEDEMSTYADTRWPWRITVTKDDGTSRSEDYAAESIGGRPVTEFARWKSEQAGVTRVELTTAFVAGEQVSPPATAKPSALGQGTDSPP
jgi:hypothetical protein